MPSTTAVQAKPIEEQQRTEIVRAALLKRVMELQVLDVETIFGAIDLVETRVDEQDEPESDLAYRTLVLYTRGDLTRERMEANYMLYRSNIKRAECEKGVPSGDGPEAIGERIRRKLQSALLDRTQRQFLDWSMYANHRDLLLMLDILQTAGVQDRRSEEESASLLTGIGKALGTNVAVFCPFEYVTQVETYVRRLTGKGRDE